MSDNHDLDQRLGELFAERKLALAPRPGATELVLERVQRVRRRRRAVRVAAPALAVVLLGGAVLGGLTSRRHASPERPSIASSTAPTTSSADLPMSGASVGSLRLGMSRAQAEATGLLDDASAKSGKAQCWTYTGRDGIEQVTINSQGISRIQVDLFIDTPQGLGIGTTYAQLQARYPESLPAAPGSATTYRVPVPGQSATWYDFDFTQADGNAVGEQVTPQSRAVGLALETGHPGC